MIKVDANRPKKMPLVTEQELKFCNRSEGV